MTFVESGTDIHMPTFQELFMTFYGVSLQDGLMWTDPL